jgi:phosphatidylserine synthase
VLATDLQREVERCVRLGALDYLNKQFTLQNFPDIFTPIWVAAALLLVGQVVLYNVRTRQLHRHEPLRTMQEWLLWTGLIVWGLILTATVFKFYFVFVLIFIAIGVATYVWVRFFRFPPLVTIYNEQLRRTRFFSQSRYRTAESTVRARRSRAQQRRRRR